MMAEVADIKVIKLEIQNSKNRGPPHPFSKFEKYVRNLHS
jgi:hypothetical protein